jgi:hypothetical protein
MKITVCGSMVFADRLVEIYYKLKELGHEPIVHKNLFSVADGTAEEIKKYDSEHHEVKKKYDYIRAWHDLIVKSDAVLICNFDNMGIINKIGGNTLIEMGFAHVENKRIFLLNPVPDMDYKDEILTMADEIINGDLSKIPPK